MAQGKDSSLTAELKTTYTIEYHSPGTFVDETSAVEVSKDNFSAKYAIEHAATVLERHGAKPFGFYLVKTTRRVAEVDGDVLKGRAGVERSGCHYINGTVLTLDDIPATKENEILRSNMRCNNIPAVVRTTNSWQHTGEFCKDDVVLRDGEIVAWGKDYY